MQTIHRFFQEPEQSFFLFGARGTGKSTWLGDNCHNALFINLLEADVLREYSARPERLASTVNAHPETKTVVIDEIQKEPMLLPVVHQLIEEHRGYRFILTGSSARKLKKAGVDLLAGRALNTTMHPFMAAEIGEAFDVARSLRDGMVPIVVASPTPGEVLKTYISIYIREEIKSEGLVRNLGAFARFLESAALSHGQPLNISNVARDCQVERKTVEGYFSILEDLLIAFRIPVFTRRARRAIACHPKFYFFDCGVFRSIRPKGPLDSIQEISGGALEGLVAQHLRAWIDYSRGDVTLSYWRTSSGSEVDFVMYGESCFHAIEVKAAERVRPEDLRALRAFKEDYPECSPLLVYMGTERLRIGDVLCVPCREFLLGLVPGKEIFRE